MAGKLFIIGSGFTKGIIETAPLNKDLLGCIRAEKDSPWDAISKRYPDKTDIEVLLTMLDMDIGHALKKRKLTRLRRNAETSLASFFPRFRFHEEILVEQPWITDFIKGVFTKGDVVVSLNYDCLLEGLLDRHNLWSPRDGYGGGDSVSEHEYRDFNSSPVKVLKIHGSENFRRRPVARRAVTGTKPGNAISFAFNEDIFPVSAKQKNLGTLLGGTSDAIIAPSFVKVYSSYFLSRMCMAMDSAKTADTLVLIGCGMRREDTFLYQLLWQFQWKGKRNIVLDPYASSISQHITETLEYDLKDVIHPIDKSLEAGWSDLIKTLER